MKIMIRIIQVFGIVFLQSLPLFGNNTKNAVKKFQKSNKLTQDGKVGKNTAHKLGWTYKNK